MGRLSKKIQCQLATTISSAASGGPSTKAMPYVAPIKPKARPRCSGGTASPITALAVGMMPPPPMPCSARPASKVAKFGASAMSSEPPANRPTQAR